MGLFKKKKLPSLNDPVFGEIDFDRGIWAFVPRAGKEGFMILVKAPENGPSQIQREFFQQIRENADDLRRRALPFIETEAQESVDIRQLSIYSLVIGNDKDSIDGRFTIEFSDKEAEVIHRVTFDSGKPVLYGCDD